MIETEHPTRLRRKRMKLKKLNKEEPYEPLRYDVI